MKCTRRQFLATTALALMPGSSLFGSVTGVAFLVLQDIPPAWKPDDISKVLEHFHGNTEPTILVASHYMDGSRTVGSAQKLPVSESIAPELLEVVSVASQLSREQRFWHLRAANIFKNADFNQPRAESVPASYLPKSTYFEYASLPRSDLSAYRSAGFRVRLICPDKSEPAAVVLEGRDQISITGGQLVDLFDPELQEGLDRLTPEAVVVLHLSLKMGADLTGPALARAAEAGVGTVVRTLRRLGLHASLARDFFLLGGVPVPRDIALLLDTADDAGNIDEFARAMTERGLPFSRISADPARGDCAVTSLPDEAPLADCILPMAAPPAPDLSASVVIGATEVNGLGADIRMHFATLDAKAVSRLDALTLDDSDRVLTIGASDVASPPLRARLLRWLDEGRNLGHVRLHDVLSLRDHVMANDPMIRRYWSLRRRRHSDPAVTTPPSAAERVRLMEDAALAWRYFERYTQSGTGLAAGTVFTGPGGRVNNEITLWDVASQVNALIAAADLRLIDRADAREAIAKAVASLPTDRLDGVLLPPSNFSARSLRTTVAGFDSCDTGRLGIALSRAVSHGLADAGKLRATLQDWGLDRSIRSGWHFTNRLGAWQDTSQSHCTDYIVPGFAFLGQTVDPIHQWADASPETEVAALYQAAALGAVSTEPFALQAIEMGIDGPTRLILDALFDAQLGWFEATGQLRCVSEAPIDREPWFIYSGLRLDREGAAAWVVETIMPPPASDADTIPRATEIISAKAAYLWQAVHPHPYNQRLVSIIRSRARIEDHGFSVGVYSDTLAPMQDYTDINTNGIILSAIAHILRAG